MGQWPRVGWLVILSGSRTHCKEELEAKYHIYGSVTKPSNYHVRWAYEEMSIVLVLCVCDHAGRWILY